MAPSSPADARIAALPLFAGMPPGARDALVAQATIHQVPAGAIIFEQGAAPTFQYVVLAGQISLFGRSDDGEVLIETVRAPELVAPAAAIAASPYLMQGRAFEDSVLVMIAATAFREAVARQPALAQALIGSLAGQVRRLVHQIKTLKLRSASERVGCYLLDLAQRQGSPTRVVLPYEKKLVAAELGLSRETFSRALSALRSQGVEVRGDVVEIRDPARLIAACRPDPVD